MSMLSRVQTSALNKPPRIVIHGKGGAGKSTFGADMTSPVFLPAEDGLGILEVPAMPAPKDLGDVMLAVQELEQGGHPYRTLVIDTVDHIEPLIWRKVCEDRTQGNKKYESIEDFGYAKGYIYADPYWTALFRALDGLRRKGMTVCILCHNELKTVEDHALGPYSRMEPKLHKRACALLYEWADIVGLLEVEMSGTEREGGKGRKTTTATATGRRILRLEDRGAFAAKNRYKLPSQIEIPEDHPYSTLRAELAARYKKDS